MLGGRIGARQALDWGLINQVWPDEDLAAQAGDLAARLASGPTRAYAATKQELNCWMAGRRAGNSSSRPGCSRTW